MLSSGFGFGPFRLDATAKALLRDGEPVLLSHKQYDGLHELLFNARRIVSKNQLIEVAWHGTARPSATQPRKDRRAAPSAARS